MKKIVAVAAVAAISMVAVSGSVEAGHAKSPSEFQGMIDNIQLRQADQRATLYGKKQHKMPTAAFQKMIEKIQQKQAKQRATLYAK